jgi:hypothetical protein
MSQLILIDKQSGLEVGRRPMEAAERYQLYHALQSALLSGEHALLSHDVNEYRMHTVAWLVADQNCVVSVTVHGRARMACGCTMGYCTCC